MKTINSQAQYCASGRYNSPNPSTGQNTGSLKNTDYVHVSIVYIRISLSKTHNSWVRKLMFIYSFGDDDSAQYGWLADLMLTFKGHWTESWSPADCQQFPASVREVLSPPREERTYPPSC